jgi:hypothetical protein
MYKELIIGGDSFKLRLTTKASIQLEKALGFNPVNLFMEIDNGKMPKLSDTLTILQASLQAYHHGYNMDKTMELFDKYIEEGHNMFDLIPVFIEVFQEAGYISKNIEEEGSEKN